MDTRRTEHANAYIARSNGLIKSASTSTCCANENALLKKAHRKFLVSSENVADYEDETSTMDVHEYLKLPSLSLSHAAVVARNASLLFNNEDVAAKKSLQHQLRYNHLTHFSDCNLNKIGLSAANNSSPVNGFSPAAAAAKCNGEYKPSEEFSSHRSLDNVLINRSINGHTGSIINFTAVNDIKQTSPSPAVTNGMSSSSDNGCGSGETAADVRSKPQPSEHSTAERRRKTSVFESAAPQLPEDDTNCGVDESSRNSDNGQAEVTSPEPQADDDDTRERRSPASATTDGYGSPPSAPEKEEKRFRRSSSLKMPKENDNPAQKKIVRFADALGLDLTDIRTFLDELPSVPKSAYSDLQNDEPAPERLSSHSTGPDTKTLVPMFKQPHTSLNFLDRIRDNFVALEFAKVSPMPICSISGTVRVRNLDFFKSVYVRYTIDGWRTSNELQAHYVPDSCDGFSDKFAFVIYLYDVNPNQRVELAVRFHCCGSIFWDNNNGSNYVFQCLPSTPVVPSYFQYFGTTNDPCYSFY